MAIKQFVIPLNADSVQSGDINFKQLVINQAQVTFRLTNVNEGLTNQLNLISNKGGQQINHTFPVVVDAGNAEVTLSYAQVKAIYEDADDNAWDYIEAYWTVGAVDVSGDSANYQLQSGHAYDTNWYPPRPKR